MSLLSASCLAPAKVNLTLRILGRRDDGYHAIESLMVPVSLCDRLSIEVSRRNARSRPRISCVVDGPQRVRGGPRNLAAAAARRVLEACSVSADVAISLTKMIPAGAGLGGGSSDAAAVLRLLPGLLGVSIGRRRLFTLACGLGADVAFFLACRPAWALGVGDVLDPVVGFPRLHLALVVPATRVSTAWAYANAVPARARRAVAGRGRGLTSSGRDTTRGGRLRFDVESISSRVFNDFERGVAGSVADVSRVRRRLRRLGAEAVVMSGSGSAVVGVFASASSAERAAQGFRSPDAGFAVRVIRRRPSGPR